MRVGVPATLVVLALSTLALAGCTSSTAPSFDLRAASDGALALDDLGADRRAGLDPNTTTPVSQAVPAARVFAGTFTPAHTCVGPCPTDAHVQRHDLSDDVPFGVPVTIEVVTTMSVPDAGLDIRVVGPEVETAGSALVSTGAPEVKVTFVRLVPGPVELRVQIVTPSTMAATVDYESAVNVTPAPRALASGVPVALDLAPGMHLTLLPADDARNPVPVALFAPDDTRWGDYLVPVNGSEVRLPAQAPVGTYVLVVGHATRPMSLVADPAADARVLPVEARASDRIAFEGTPGGPARAAGTLDTTDPTVRVRLVVETRPGSVALNGAGSLTGTMHALVTGPQGAVLDDNVSAPFSCVLCVVPMHHVVAAPQGPVHPPGSYQWSAEGEVGPEADAWLEALVWTR